MSTLIPDRPNRPLVVRCGHGSATRRVTFPSAATARFDSLQSRVEECFHLSASPYFLTYVDDDGEEFSIRSDADLTEAIAYFDSNDDGQALSTYSGGEGAASKVRVIPPQKITLRVEVTVEYDGPSLSDTSSLSSFRTGTLDDGDEQTENSWRSDDYTESYRSYGGHDLQSNVIEEEPEDGLTEYGNRPTLATGNGPTIHGEASSDPSLEIPLFSPTPPHGSSAASSSALEQKSPQMRSPSSRASTIDGLPAQTRNLSLHDVPRLVQPGPLTGPDSDPAPSLLTHSELGHRWLREQSRLFNRRVVPGSKSRRTARTHGSDDESLASDDEKAGNLALIRDARGKYYYSYQSTGSSSLSSRSEAEITPPGQGLDGSFRASSTMSGSLPIGPQPETASERLSLAEPSGHPLLAPDCSACGTRLDYIRYVCNTCGEAETWGENASGRPAVISTRTSSGSDQSEGSGRTEGGAEPGVSLVRTRMATEPDNVANVVTSRNGSSVTEVCDGSQIAADGSDSSPNTKDGCVEAGLTPPASPSSPHEHSSGGHRSLPFQHGYELCSGCIEQHGIIHTNAAAKEAIGDMTRNDGNRRRKEGIWRHTFREKIWDSQDWQDVEYNEESKCTICQSRLFSNRFKCVSCSKFDLCRSCFRKVAGLHPAHAFLSLPDRPFAFAGPSRSDGYNSSDGISEPQIKPLRHPGAFCHKRVMAAVTGYRLADQISSCLQDIVGPRFHCAVCPSWDLCIQCEGAGASGNGTGHMPEHIMMKIPIPLASAEVEAVSRRARERWFQQDSTTVAAANPVPRPRSSSPTNETVYAGIQPRREPQHAATGSLTARDALDHGCRCGNCAEWIMGRRYQCANCASEPQAYNLCSLCELRSHRVHDPRHVFFKFDRPVHIALTSSQPLLPLLYRSQVGQVPAGAVINPQDPTAHLRYVLHRETLCDIHSDQIRGAWLRCAHCAADFDICQEAEEIADHDPVHVFVVFKARVDMAAFRALADLGAAHSKPLLTRQVYLN